MTSVMRRWRFIGWMYHPVFPWLIFFTAIGVMTLVGVANWLWEGARPMARWSCPCL